MNRKDCLERIKNDNEFHHLYWKNYNNAKSFYKTMIKEMRLLRPSMNIVLHHFDIKDNEYELWKVIPMYSDEHAILHNRISKSGMSGKTQTEETKIKIGNKNRGKRRTDEQKENIKKNIPHLKGKLSPNYGKVRTEESKQKNREKHIGNTYNRGRKWWTNGIEFKFQFIQPEGFWRGSPGKNQYSKVA